MSSPTPPPYGQPPGRPQPTPATLPPYQAPPPGEYAQVPPPPGHPGAPPFPQTPQIPADQIRPRKRWYWIGGAIMLLGVIAAIAYGVISFLGIADTVDDFARVAPGTETVQIDSPGEYVIYNEDSSFRGSVEITSPDGRAVSTPPYLTGLDYTFNGKSGRAVSTFQADEPGAYTVSTDTNIAIGTSIAGDLVRTILIPFGIGGLTLLVGLLVIIVTAVKRSGSRKRLAGQYPSG